MKNPRILVPIDFSERSQRALGAANQWAGMFGGEITPMHTFEAPSDLDGFHFYGPKGAVTGDLVTIERAVRDLLVEAASGQVDAERLREGIFVLGHPARAIAHTAANYDLIVMSSHGRSGFSRFLLGSVTDKVIRLAAVPVLVVTEDAPAFPPKRILVPTDLSPNSEAAFPLAKAVAEAAGAAVELLYVHHCDDPEAVDVHALEQSLRTRAGPHFAGLRRDVEVNIAATRDSAHRVIHQSVQEKHFGLVVMATTGHSELEHMMMGSTSAQVMREVHCSVLLVNPRHRQP